MAAWPKPAFPVCLFGQILAASSHPAWAAPSSNAWACAHHQDLAGVPASPLSKREVLGLCSFEQVVKKECCLGPTGISFQLESFLEGRAVRSLKGCKCHQVGQEKGESAPRCQGCRSLFCPWLKKDGIWLHWSCSSLRPAMLRQDSSAARGNHRQLLRNGVRLSSLRHLLNLALFSGICYPFLGFPLF